MHTDNNKYTVDYIMGDISPQEDVIHILSFLYVQVTDCLMNRKLC